ncbi:unnamed protein product, partial [Rotaria socialis]
HDPPRRIIHEVLLGISKEDGTAVPNYSSSQRTIQRKRKKKKCHCQDRNRFMRFIFLMNFE